jgi:hypothetical protein
VLGANARQLNRPGPGGENQLVAWNKLGLFDRQLSDKEIAGCGKLAAADDESAPLAHRARSYLDANCAHCHRPGGARPEFDLRFDTPLGKQKLLNGPLIAADLGVPGAKVVVPGDRAKSMLYQRMVRRTDAFNMPPLASHLVDRAAAEVVGRWIDELGPSVSASVGGHFRRLWWFTPGDEHGNPVVNRRFRVNSPEVGLDPKFADRPEVRGNGMMQIKIGDALKHLAGADLALELWGGHPGTTNRRVTVNGRSTFRIPDAPDKDCQHLYPVLPLKLTDLVPGFNALQFACDQGTTFWGHFIVGEACLRTHLKPDHLDLTKLGLAGATLAVKAEPAADREQIRLALDGPPALLAKVAGVRFEGHYLGYDENGRGSPAGWHGFPKRREPVGYVGVAEKPPFAADWDVSMLPAQDGVKVRAVVRFKDAPDLEYVTPALDGLRVAPPRRAAVRLYPAKDIPHPFWVRADRKQSCTIDLDGDPAKVERAELHVVIWDGGAGDAKEPFTLNGKPLPVAGAGKHDVLYRRIPVEPGLLKKGPNRVELHSDTEYHGIEVLLPGPALVVRWRE